MLVTIRAHVSAAPLKPLEFWLTPRMPVTFPRSRERGPVEARRTVRFRLESTYFRAHVSAAPLKRGFAARRSMPRLSALT